MPPRVRNCPRRLLHLSARIRPRTDALIGSHSYIIEKGDGSTAHRIRSLDAPFCPDCGSLCSGYDTRSRRVISDDGNSTVYRLRRVRCPDCDKLHLVLPDFMCPRKHYSAAVIADVLKGRGAGCPAEASTMWRWRQQNHPPGLQCLSSRSVINLTHSDTKGDAP